MFISLHSSILLLASLLHLSIAAPADETSPAASRTLRYGGSGQCPATIPFTSYVTTTYTTTYTTIVSTVQTITGVTSRYCPASVTTTITRPPPYPCTFNTSTCIRILCVYLETTTVCNDPCCRARTRTVTEQQTCATACPGGCNTFVETVTSCAPPSLPSNDVGPAPTA